MTANNKQENRRAGVADKLFHRLQLKFTLVVSAICSVSIAICFAAAIFVNLFAMEFSITTALENAVNNPISSAIGPGESGGSEEIVECSIAIVYSDGCIVLAKYGYMSDGDFNAVLAAAMEGVTDITKSDHTYRIASRMDNPAILGGRPATVYAFYDYTYRLHVFQTQTLALGFAFIGLVLLFVLFSYLISGRMLSPAHDALVKQKDLIANASHELKTPITIINANLDVIKSDNATTIEDNAKWLENIETQTKRMNTLITEMLEMSSFESAAYKPDITRFDLGELTEGSCLSFEAACFERGISLELSREEDMTVDSDEKSWMKLIGILFDNAIKYSLDGGKIGVSLSSQQTKKKKYASLAVSNNGNTIPPEEIKMIFERFHKVGDGANSFGLGLSMAKTICENLGGKITCVSEDGLTTFTVRIPV